MFTPADHTYPDLPPCERTEETSCPALTQASTPGLDHRHGSGEALTPCAVSFPRAGAQFPPTEPAACLLLALSACEKSDAVIAPCAADREPLSPPAPPPGSSLAGCRGGSADVEPATQRSSAVGKHRRRR